MNDNLQKSTLTDLIGRQHTSVIYQQDGNVLLECIPTTAGITVNITIIEKPESNQLDFYIDKQEGVEYFIKDNQYTVFETIEKEDINKAIIYISFLQDAKGLSSFENSVEIASAGNQWKYSIILDETFLNDPNIQYPLTISPTFELYRNKMPDSAIYANKPNANVYLADYAVMGGNDLFGNSQHYLRFRINYVFKSYVQNVKSAAYILTVLSKNPGAMSIEMLRMKDMWSNTGVNWNTRSNTYDKESTFLISTPGRCKCRTICNQ